MDLDGAQVFARYAYPPNSLGYCGPADSDALLHYGAAGTTDRGLVELARGFEGAWPYLQLIAGATHIGDPLDRRVVEAYWVGGPLLESVGMSDLAGSMDERFRARAGPAFPQITEGVVAGSVPHHNFHVFEVYPWRGLLRDSRKSTVALNVLDRCRIRWGRVVSVEGDTAVVGFRPLEWDGVSLSLGEPTTESARVAVDGTGFLDDLAAGDMVSLHWEWVCDRLSPGQLEQLRRYTARHLDIANTRLWEQRRSVTVE